MSKKPLEEFTVHKSDGIKRTVYLRGRDAWALSQLIRRGNRGCSPLDEYSNPGIRWSAYVHKLKKHNIEIERKDEKHGGPFAGTHARYFLVSNVTCAESEAA